MTDSAPSLLRDLAPPDGESRARVEQRAATVLRPRGAFARLDEVAAWLATWQRTAQPAVADPAAAIFVADHGVAVEAVSAYPSSVTREVLRALEQGAATAAVLARELGVRLEVVDVGVGRPSGNLLVEPALTPARFTECFETGRRVVSRVGGDLLVVGEMGIGNTTAAAAVCAALFGLPAEEWAGRGTGVDEDALARKTAVVEAARRRIEQETSPLEVLRQLGGAELVAIAGAVVEARRRSTPVLLDGFVVTAAVAPLELALPGALDHCIAAHRSAERGHQLLLDKLGKQPLLDLGLRLGEASGALLALPLVKLAAASVTEVATFQEWGL